MTRRCEPCGQPIEKGDLCRIYEDVGEAHVDCDDPRGKRFPNPDRIEADPAEWDDPADAPTFLVTHRAE